MLKFKTSSAHSLKYNNLVPPLQLKKNLLQACQDQMDQKLAQIQKRLAAIRDSRDNETKSSAGDKYETGRAMMQMEEEKSRHQLAEALNVSETLKQIKHDRQSKQVSSGSLVFTNQGVYFISIGLGKVKLDGQLYFCISPQAPVAQKMVGLQAGSSFDFQGKLINIQDIY